MATLWLWCFRYPAFLCALAGLAAGWAGAADWSLALSGVVVCVAVARIAGWLAKRSRRGETAARARLASDAAAIRTTFSEFEQIIEEQRRHRRAA